MLERSTLKPFLSVDLCINICVLIKRATTINHPYISAKAEQFYTNVSYTLLSGCVPYKTVIDLNAQCSFLTSEKYSFEW